MGANSTKAQKQTPLTGGLAVDYQTYLKTVESQQKQKLNVKFQNTVQQLRERGEITPANATQLRKTVMDEIKRIRAEEYNALKSIDHPSPDQTSAMTREQFLDPYHNILTAPQFNALTKYLEKAPESERRRISELNDAFVKERRYLDRNSQRLRITQQ